MLGYDNVIKGTSWKDWKHCTHPRLMLTNLAHLIIVLTHSKHKHYYCGVVFNWFIIAAVGTIGVVEQVLVCSCLALVIIHSIKNVMLNQTWQGFLEAQFMGSSDVC